MKDIYEQTYSIKGWFSNNLVSQGWFNEQFTSSGSAPAANTAPVLLLMGVG